MEIAHIVKYIVVVGTLMKHKEAKLSGNESTSESQHQGEPSKEKTVKVLILPQLAYHAPPFTKSWAVKKNIDV